MKPLYLDSTATTALDPRVFDAMRPFLEDIYGNPSSIHRPGILAKREINLARQSIGRLLNIDPQEMIFTSGGTESINLALKGLAFAHPEKKEIITTPIEHKATLKACDFLSRLGFTIHYVKVDHQGFVDLLHLESLISSKTLVCSIIWGNNEIGTIQDINAISKITQKHGVYLHVDAVQMIHHFPLDLKKYPIDLLTLSAHKFRGPKGVGLLYLKDGIRIEPLIHGGAQEFDRRAGTENVAGIVGMRKALELVYASHHIHRERLNRMAQSFLNVLEKKEDVRLNGPLVGPNRIPGQLNISFKYQRGFDMAFELDKHKIYVSTGSACNSNAIEPSHVLTALSVDPDYIGGSLRITFSEEHTDDDIGYLLYTLSEIL